MKFMLVKKKKRKRLKYVTGSDMMNQHLHHDQYERKDVLSIFKEKKADENIQVTKTFLPPMHEYITLLEEVWDRGWVTNNGPLLEELQFKLKKYLGVKHLFIVNNGTIALQTAIKVLGLKGEIITTPFSYVATTSSIVWEGCKPVFVDIDPDTLCMDPGLIENSITPDTKAILATHVYGNPCEIEKIEEIASRYQLKVIYDAAHAFDVMYKDTSVLNSGDISTLSFHGTKLFHTIEGGAIITEDDELAEKISYMTNFGHNGPERFVGLGINCKNSEYHAAMGLCVLPRVKALIRRRKEISELYNQLIQGCGLARPLISDDVRYNYAYYPVLFPSEQVMHMVKDALNDEKIYPRRYFYPSLTSLPYVAGQSAPIAEDIASRILCLPMYYELEDSAVIRIANIIKKSV